METIQARVERLLSAVNEHDVYTGSHSCRVASYSTLLARLVGMDQEAVDVVRQAGLLHDIGKLTVPNSVLTKKERLTEQEFHLIKTHSTTGASMLAAERGLDHLIPIVLHHHERWDGRGYPTGLSGVDIPIESRLIFIADAFDAMITIRPYGKVHSTHEAIAEITRCAGTQFDPMIAEAFRLAYDGGLIEEFEAPRELTSQH